MGDEEETEALRETHREARTTFLPQSLRDREKRRRNILATMLKTDKHIKS